MRKLNTLLLISIGLGVSTEVALLFNWSILASNGPVGGGVIDFTWIWPLVWLGMAVIGGGSMFLERMIAPTEELHGVRHTAGVMLLRLLGPMLLLVGPAIMFMYSLIMILTAVGVTGQMR